MEDKVSGIQETVLKKIKSVQVPPLVLDVIPRHPHLQLDIFEMSKNL